MTEIKQIFISILKLKHWFKPVSAAPLAIYRVGFGILMLFSTLRFIAKGWIEEFYIQPEFHFSYLGFEWIPFPNATALYIIFGLLILSSLLITLGFLYRIATIIFFIGFTYVELLDKTTYLNHYYFVSLIAFLLIFIPANRYFSIDARLGICKKQNQIPAWQSGILKFQIAIVYIFAGIAKLEPDWLFNAQPLKYWLHTAHHFEWIGPILKQDWVAYLFAWFGCLYDLLIVFFLLHSKTRNKAYLLVILFHFTTWILFPIGVFPWVMIVGTTIFLAPRFHERIISFFSKSDEQKTFTPFKPKLMLPSKFVAGLIGIYVFLQVIIPLRHLVYPGEIFWHEEGYRFSWRVMLMEKAGYATFYLHDPESAIEYEIDNKNHLTAFQEKQMSTQPDMILEYADYLQKVYSDTTISVGPVDLRFKNPEIRAEIFVTLNGRPNQKFVDKKHNLAAIDNDLTHRDWLEPFAP